MIAYPGPVRQRPTARFARKHGPFPPFQAPVPPSVPVAPGPPGAGPSQRSRSTPLKGVDWNGTARPGTSPWRTILGPDRLQRGLTSAVPTKTQDGHPIIGNEPSEKWVQPAIFAKRSQRFCLDWFASYRASLGMHQSFGSDRSAICPRSRLLRTEDQRLKGCAPASNETSSA